MARYGGAFVAGAVIGGVAGTALTLWRAPQAGRLTRSQLGDQLKAHAGPAAGLLEAAGHGLNAAGTRIVQGVAITTRFVEELVDPTPASRLGQSAPVPAAPAATTPVATTPADGGEPTIAGPAATTASDTSVPYRPAAMTATPFPAQRPTR